jgi:hypothetical protein
VPIQYCYYCRTEKQDSDFYKQSKRRCKVCTQANNMMRYKRDYRSDRLAKSRHDDYERKRLVIEHTEIERAYAAGLFDGEGCVRITKRGAAGGTAMRVGQHTMMVQLNNTDEAMIRWLQARWPAALSFTEASQKENRKARWAWSLTANNALHFLDEIYEFSLTKRRQIKWARRFQRYVQGVGRPRTEQIERLQSVFYAEIKTLNRRGFIE